MERRMAVYRGSLKSCNYHCSYCPFSKHTISGQELDKDRKQWLAFVQSCVQQPEDSENPVFTALMAAPYGEALIHPWYWEGLARISALPYAEAVGAQTNLGFPLQSSLECYRSAGGRIKKLRLWATFHPEMTTVSEFVQRCKKLTEAGVVLSAGAVGVPENMHLLRQLRNELPKDTYLWLNKMDGLGRPYTAAEKQAFSDIDPYFYRECIPVRADVSKCRGRIFAEGEGKVRLCNIAPAAEVSWKEVLYNKEAFLKWQQTADCSRKRCSCYLAYGGRNDMMNQALFGPYPLFRIPRRPKAAFFDIEGTLFPKEDSSKSESRNAKSRNNRTGDVPQDILAGLEVLAKEKTALFFATTLPYEEALRRCRKFRHLFSGGIFSGGAHLRLETADGRREYFYFLDEECDCCLQPFEKKYHFRLLAYRSKGQCYKLTLFRTFRHLWEKKEAEEMLSLLPDSCRKKVRYIIEENCLQIISAKADKAGGVRMICQWLRIPVTEIFAAGDSAEDAAMMGYG